MSTILSVKSAVRILSRLINFANPNQNFASKSMSSFAQILNPITGRSEWESRCDNYDYHQEVARSAFADMLHDSERNEKYFAALRKTIRNLHEAGKEAHVLDIGTGTGLLSMMAVKSGADSVTSCEAFMPMANCAEQVIKANGMSDQINLIKKRSTELKIGLGGDLTSRANVLVTEVFDTELIGEGAIDIYNHAHRELLTDDCVMIPSRATVYAQVVESPLAQAWNKPKILASLDGDVLLTVPQEIQQCEGECAVHDIQLSQFPAGQFSPLTDPVEIFQFDWSDLAGVPKKRRQAVKIVPNRSGVMQVVFFWWDIKMDRDGEILLSCAPYWAHPDHELLSKSSKPETPIQNLIPWRDHWTQALYYLPKPLTVTKDSEAYLLSYHDEYSFWFDARNPSEKDFRIERLRCTCGFHMAYSRTRIGQINNTVRTKKFLKVLEEEISPNSKVLSISDGSLLGLATSAMGAQSVACLESNTMSRDVLLQYIRANKLENVRVLKSLDDLENDLHGITHVVAEPYFITSILPWDNFYFGTALMKIKEKLKDDVVILPAKAKIFAVAVEYLDLYKIRTVLGNCEGFDHSVFDKFIENSSQLADAIVEAQPLWEYPCKALSARKTLLSVDFRAFDKILDNSGSIDIQSSGTCNGLALWVDWSLDGTDCERSNVSTGPTLPIEVGKFVSWDMYSRQGVHLFQVPKLLNKGDTINWNVKFKPQNGDISFKFTIV